jgi:hypothetical protein
VSHQGGSLQRTSVGVAVREPSELTLNAQTTGGRCRGIAYAAGESDPEVIRDGQDRVKRVFDVIAAEHAHTCSPFAVFAARPAVGESRR